MDQILDFDRGIVDKPFKKTNRNFTLEYQHFMNNTITTPTKEYEQAMNSRDKWCEESNKGFVYNKKLSCDSFED
jgi:hypothetical protein